ncbi:MAG TPA: DUF1667 domain-containing protein [Rectinema sp.]|nr:DUF1667 domain-containing protein [Rectinema sp.]HRU04052.1 DUF1667 domain-containing protein [Rectinema sp.]
MKELICITCPMGCHLSIDSDERGELKVTGNRCIRGEQYAREEVLNPKRVVTYTCEALFPEDFSLAAGSELVHRVPVRTTNAFPKERIPELIATLRSVSILVPVARGDIVIKDALGTGIDVIVTRTIALE